ncbi:MAG: acetyl-CoA C-acyltransferase, partial [Hyphomicrobiaceae bacterium]
GNTSSLHDGAAIAIVVSERMWQSLGKPPALRLLASAAMGVAASAEGSAPISAMEKLYARINGFDRASVGVVEMGEVSAAQAIAFVEGLGIDEAIVNPDGGTLARGHPLGASGAVLVTRVFTHLVRTKGNRALRRGAVVQSAAGGLGLAAMFEAAT